MTAKPKPSRRSRVLPVQTESKAAWSGSGRDSIDNIARFFGGKGGHSSPALLPAPP